MEGEQNRDGEGSGSSCAASRPETHGHDDHWRQPSPPLHPPQPCGRLLAKMAPDAIFQHRFSREWELDDGIPTVGRIMKGGGWGRLTSCSFWALRPREMGAGISWSLSETLAVFADTLSRMASTISEGQRSVLPPQRRDFILQYVASYWVTFPALLPALRHATPT